MPEETAVHKQPRRMSLRMLKYRKNRAVYGMTQYDAARSAGYSDNYCKQACRIEKLVKNSLSTYLERAGLTDKRIAETIAEGALEATKLCGLDAVEHADWQNRHKFLITGLELKGLAPDPRFNNQQTDALHNRVLAIVNNYNVTVIQSKKDAEKAKDTVDVDAQVENSNARNGVTIV